MTNSFQMVIYQKTNQTQCHFRQNYRINSSVAHGAQHVKRIVWAQHVERSACRAARGGQRVKRSAWSPTREAQQVKRSA